MNKKILLWSRKVIMSAALLLSTVVLANESNVRLAIKDALPQYEIEKVTLHEASGLYVVALQAGPTLHMTKDGKYFVAGDLYRVEGKSLENETEKAKLAKIETLPEADMVVYKAANEKTHITVFTDVDCAYCRMLHKEISELNQAGITVRYLAFPRSGIGSGGYNKMVSIWCSDDPKQWLNKAKLGEKVPRSKCVNPVASQYNLGREVGVRGTPSIVSKDGSIFPGYSPAAELIQRLGL